MKKDGSTLGAVLCRERKRLGCELSSGKRSGGVGNTCACSRHRHTGRSAGPKRKTGVEYSPWSIQLQRQNVHGTANAGSCAEMQAAGMLGRAPIGLGDGQEQ